VSGIHFSDAPQAGTIGMPPEAAKTRGSIPCRIAFQEKPKKMFDYIQPLYTIFLLIAFVSLIRIWRQNKTGKPLLLAAALFGLFLISWPPFVWLLLQPFERPFPPGIDRSNDAQAIVVLSGNIQFSPLPGLPAAEVASDTFERCQYAAYLHTHWRPLPVLASGGGNQPGTDTPPYAELMKDAIVREGVPGTLVWMEGKSHNTHENAEFSAQLLRQKGVTKIVLVTDAYHMRRAAMSFRKEGLIVVPAACAYRSFDKAIFGELTPGWQSIRYTEDLLHETVGLIWYKIHGWI
jgi:uncharacterized SAM-binding protein YcdF (DUF218 family)